MLGVGRLPAPPLLLKTTTINTHLTFPSLLVQKLQLNHYSSLCMVRNGSCLFAQKKLKDSRFSVIELERQDFDDDGEFDDDEDDDFFDDDGDDDGDDEDEDDDVIVPYDEMDAWLERKPRGFGEGKVYDTSVEDKLLEEIEKSREAQLANVSKLRSEVKEPKLNTELKKEVKASEGISSGILVRINNLPKKKNIDRDLKSAFKGVNGITNISPVVSGNKKTREPVCKGFAFVDFKSLEEANRFIQVFSGQNIAFGKAEKRVKCEILKSRDASNEGSEHDAINNISKSSFPVPERERDQVDKLEQNDTLLELWEDDDDAEFDEEPDEEAVAGNLGLLSTSEQADFDGPKSRMKQSGGSLSSIHKEKKPVKKKPVAKKNPENKPKLNIPGSAKRLKVHEKAKLADVFSRYGVREALVTKET